MRQLIVCPEGGLANRLRVLASAIALQHQHGVPLSCYWSINYAELNAHFNQLFEPIPHLTFAPLPHHLHKLKPALSRNYLRRTFLHFLNRCYGIKRYLYEDSSHPGSIEAALPSLGLLLKGSGAPVLIRTWQSFGDFQPFINCFAPNVYLRQRIQSLIPDSAAPPIGIHVRRSDHVTSIRFSPLHAFFRAADVALDQNQGRQLFVCSDDALVREAFRERYDRQVIISEAALSRSSVTAIQDAVVDLFCLARCSLVIGSYRSSFSEMAAMLGHRPLRTIGPEEDGNAR